MRTAVVTATRGVLLNVAGILIWAGGAAGAAVSTATDPFDALRDSAARGDAEAQFELGNAYWLHDGAEAAAWWLKASEQGHAKAQLALANAYLLGVGVPKDQAAGVALIRKAAEQGLVDAQFALGLGYEVGTIIPQDTFLAVYWYRKAADGGHARA